MENKITYKDLEDKVKERLNSAIERGHGDNFVHAKNLSATLVNLIRAGYERKSRKK